MSMLRSSRAKRTPREDVGQLPALPSRPGLATQNTLSTCYQVKNALPKEGVVLKAGEGVGDCPIPKKHTKKSRGTDHDPQSEWVGREHHMRRIIVLLAAMAAMVVVYAGAALAANITCPGGPCVGTEQNDRITGSQVDDNIQALGGLDVVTARGGTILSTAAGPGTTSLADSAETT